MPQTALFVGLVIAAYATALTQAGRAPAVAVGVTLDLVVVIPLAFHFLVVRRRGLPWVTTAPVLVASALAAAAIVPADEQGVLRVLEAGVATVEVAVIGWIGWRAAQAVRREAGGDVLARLDGAARTLLGSPRAAALCASEIGMLYYALFSWRAAADVPPGYAAFTHHRRNSHGAIVFALLLLMLVEGIAVHVLLQLWSPLAAWIVSGLTAYGALWIIGDYRATVLRPILVGEHDVVLRAGLRWTVTLPRDAITGVEGEQGKKTEGLALTFLTTPTMWINVGKTVRAAGAYGMTRRTGSFGVRPDDEAPLRAALHVSERTSA